MSNFQSKTKELVNTATAAGVLYRDAPERQFKDMWKGVERLYPERPSKPLPSKDSPEYKKELEKAVMEKQEEFVNQIETAGQVYGIQWARNKVAQERMGKLLKKYDINIKDMKSVAENNKEFVNMLNEDKGFQSLLESRNRIAKAFGISPVGGAQFNGTEAEKKQEKSQPVPFNKNMDMAVLQRRFAKIPNPMTAAEFKGGPEW